MKNVIRKTAAHFGQSEEHVLQEIQAAIDAAWLSQDPAAQTLQKRIFPAGKPDPATFLSTLALVSFL